MLGPSLAPRSELKKNYKFVWALNAMGTDLTGGVFEFAANYARAAKGLVEEVKSIANSVKSLFKKGNSTFRTSLQEDLITAQIYSAILTTYVSQLTKSVSLPADEIETDEYQIGGIKYPVPKGKKLGDITVTYYDDTFDTVYSFHKSWLELTFPKTLWGSHTFAVRPFEKTMSATYAPYENTLDIMDYGMFSAGNALADAINGGLQNAVSGVIGSSAYSTMSTAATTLFSLTGFQGVQSDIFLTYGSKQTFNSIYPVQVKRSSAERDGSSLATVEVVYRRVPDVINALMPPVSGINTLTPNKYGY